MRLLAVVSYFAFFCSGTAVARQGYTNPVRDSNGDMVRVADPFVYRHGGVYYLIGTTRQHNGFACYTSPDLVHWTFAGAAYTKPDGHYGTGSFWAPEVKYYNGKFYLTYSAYNPANRKLLSSLAVSDRPEGPYKDLYAPWFDFGYSAIDCHLFVDRDKAHTPYLFFSRNTSIPGFASGENYVVQLTPDLSGFVGRPQMISQASQEWEMVDWAHCRGNEGPFVFYRKGRYYMTYSANNTGYSHYGVGYATAKHPLGPWLKADENPILTTDLSKGVSSPGHNSIVASPDGSEMFIVYHRHADPEGTRPSFDRVVCIDRIFVDRQGRLKVQGPTSTPQPMPSGAE